MNALLNPRCGAERSFRHYRDLPRIRPQRHGRPTSLIRRIRPRDEDALRDDYRARLPYVVAVGEDGAILGYAYASAFRTRPAYNWLVEDSIYLSPGGTRAGHRPGFGRRTRHPLHGPRFPPDGRRDRRLKPCVDRRSRAAGFEMCGTMNATGFKLAWQAMAGHGFHADCAGRRVGDGSGCGCLSGDVEIALRCGMASLTPPALRQPPFLPLGRR